ncbi:Protein of unknown function [Tistlia consotensis]|uniref:SAM-dependent methyltransferase n=2 Tax=Tistlia TaxID=1321364 RepID=A0A1Y6C6L4_9PROT|nr:Protein of unknown function [Tistlia consotensis USBA 355]SNR79128.1 Protein of unknown function [Tistlia consotensis]
MFEAPGGAETGRDGRLFAPAAARNAAPLAAVLERLLPGEATVLELASGSGQHAVYLAERFPWMTWQPSDADPAARASIEAWRAAAGLGNLRPVLALDAAAPGWAAELAPVSAVLCLNMIHIAPWEACLGLLAGAATLLPEGGPLILYGPFRRAGIATAPSNEAFDRSLRGRDRRWGLRSLEAVAEAALAQGLELAEIIEMPANNLTVALRRSADSAAHGEAL